MDGTDLSVFDEFEFNHGSVVSLKLTDFMQFNYVEFWPGPTLNVILGPNGAGKSTIVNGIALALGAKTAVLGRADHIVDFIRIGCNRATLEIELRNDADNEGNIHITREIFREATEGKDLKEKNQSKHCRWFLHNKEVKESVIKKIVKDLNIQTDNLCQFLPQDKVHDFSKLNPKDLLVKTVEAVGDAELREDHKKLKELQVSSTDSVDKLKKKQQTLERQIAERDEMEQAVKNFETKTKIEKKLRLLTQKKEWVMTSDAKKHAENQQASRDNAYKKVKAEESKLVPIREEIRKLMKSASKTNEKVADLTSKCSNFKSQCFKKNVSLEEFPSKITNLENEFDAILRQEEEKKEELNKMEKQYERLKEEYREAMERSDNDETNSMEEKCKHLERELENINQEKTALERGMRELNYERKAVEQRLLGLKDEKDQLNNVKRQKLDTLKNSLQNGHDAVKAAEWLSKNRDQFQGNVYDPILLLLDVQEAETNAKYIENAIGQKDLVAFAAENAEDTNALLRQFREVMKLRVNVVQVDPDANPAQMRPAISGEMSEELKKKYGFKGYLKDMISCPDPIKAYLCKLYFLHEIPVFSAKADSFMAELITKFSVFFTGDIRNQHSVSRYNKNASSTSSNRIAPKQWLQISLNKTRISEIAREIKKNEKEVETMQNQIKDDYAKKSQKESELEAKKSELKGIQQKIHAKRVLKGRLDAQEQKILIYKKTTKVLDLEKERAKMKARKEKLVMENVALADEVTKLVVEMSESKTQIDMLKASLGPIERKEKAMKEKMDECTENLHKAQETLGEKDVDLRAAQRDYTDQLKKARNTIDPNYNMSEPPKAVVKEWRNEGIDQLNAQDALRDIHICENELECLDDVEPEKIQKYKDIKEGIETLQMELANLEDQVLNNQHDTDVIRERWVSKLETLVENISTQFSSFFERMGFAGNVQLNKGNGNEDDFSNYGFDVMVKFREKLPLQRLDPFKQSGGERSVSTALYMMALQALTKVPFRCVDEINQGMDERNERRVFDLLIETAVEKNSAQYFLLTPKLLPDLNYERGVKVLVVHNSEKMCANDEWDLAAFKERGKARKIA